ncbi:MAG: hypothetical protein WKG03_00385 [Telluria sp.]
MSHFNGPDYVAKRDDERLTAQMSRIWAFMCGGAWHTLGQIAANCSAPEASVSAQLRHLRKDRFGGHAIEKKHLGRGLYEYRLIPNTEAQAA